MPKRKMSQDGWDMVVGENSRPKGSAEYVERREESILKGCGTKWCLARDVQTEMSFMSLHAAPTRRSTFA